jgi:hypothetical protein
MVEINCYIPIRIRVIGTLGDDQFDHLAAAVGRALAPRIALADRTVQANATSTRPHGVVDTAGVREPYDVGRQGPGTSFYSISSYQGPAKPTAVPLRGTTPAKDVAGSLRRVELYLREEALVAVIDGGPPPLVFVLTEPPKVSPGQSFQWGYRDGVHRLSLGAQGEVVVRFRGPVKDLQAFAELAARALSPVPAIIYAGAGESPPPGGEASLEGERAEPLVGDEGVFAGNAALAGLYLDFLARYANVKVDRDRAANGLTVDQVRTITRDNQRAQTVTRYFTQGWKEFQSLGGNDLGVFAVLEEAVLNQWDRSNYTALHNLLEIGKDPDGLGLYRRGTPLRYYDQNGEPVPAIGGGFRDSGYRAAAPPSAALKIQITDRGLLQVFEAIRHITLDEQIQIYQAAKGYADNRDLLWPEVRNGWDAWADVDKELQRQMGPLVLFLAGHFVALVLKRASDPRAKAIGVTLEQILKISGRIFQIMFAGELSVLAYRCGREMSLIRREEGKPLDALSQRHLATAAVYMRQLLTMAVAAGLSAAIVKTAEFAAVTLGPPPGGGGLVPAPAGASAPVRGPGAGAAGASAAIPGPPGLTYGVPVPPSQMMKEGEESGSGARERPREESRGGGTSPEESGRETGREKERRELAEDRPSRPAKGTEYFDYQGGDRGSFRAFVRQLRTHVNRLVRGGERDPAPNLKDAERVLDQDAEGFIRSRSVLNKRWDGWSQRLARQLLSLDAQIRASRGDRALIRELTARKGELEKAKAELDDFGRGKVGDKRPDLVELFFRDDPRAEVTDITDRPLDDPFHNFKTLFYVEVIKALFGWENVLGREYSSPTQQRVITE